MDRIAGAGVFEEDFFAGDLAVDQAEAADAETIESFQRSLEASYVGYSFGLRSTQRSGKTSRA